MKLGIISDIHEDIENLRKAMKQLQKAGWDEIACLGDIVGFSVPSFSYLNKRDANKCIDLVKSNCTIVVPGNHDLYAARRTPKYSGDFNYPDNWYQLPFDEREELANGKLWLYEDHDLSPMLNRRNLAYLHSLAEYKIANFDNIPLLFTHYAYPDISGSQIGFVKSNTELQEHYQFVESNQCMISFSGHRHVEGVILGRKSFMNHKSFGQFMIEKDVLWINGPCLARSKKKPGYMIFNTENFELDVKPL